MTEYNSQDPTAVQIARIDEIVQNIHYRLFGNGQPGELALLSKRQDVSENFIAMTKGALVVIGTIITIMGGAIITLWGKH